MEHILIDTIGTNQDIGAASATAWGQQGKLNGGEQ